MNIDQYDGINDCAFLSSFPFDFGFLDESTVPDPEQEPPQSQIETESRVESIQTTALSVDEIQKNVPAQTSHNNFALDSMYAWEAQDPLRASDLDCGSTRQASPSNDQILSRSHHHLPLSGATYPDGSNDIDTISSMNQTSDASISLNAGISGPSSIDTAAIHACSAFSFEPHTSTSLYQPLNSIPLQDPNISFRPLSASRVSTQPEAGFVNFPDTFSSALGSTSAFNPTYVQGDLSTESMNPVTHHASSFEITQHVTGLTSSDQPKAPVTWYPPQNPGAAIQPFGSETVLQHPDPPVLLPDPSSESWTQPPGLTNLLVPQAILSAPIQSHKNTSAQPISGQIVSGGSANSGKRKAIEVDSSSSQVVRLAKVRSVPDNYLVQFSIDSPAPKKRKRTKAQAQNKKDVEEAGGQCFLCRIKKSKCSPKKPCKTCQKILGRFADSSTILARACIFRDRLAGTRLFNHRIPEVFPRAPMTSEELKDLFRRINQAVELLDPPKIIRCSGLEPEIYTIRDLVSIVRHWEIIKWLVPDAVQLDSNFFLLLLEEYVEKAFRVLEHIPSLRFPEVFLRASLVTIETINILKELPSSVQSAVLYAQKLLEIRSTTLLAMVLKPDFLLHNSKTWSSDNLIVAFSINYIPEAKMILSTRYHFYQLVNWRFYWSSRKYTSPLSCSRGFKTVETPSQLEEWKEIVCSCQLIMYCLLPISVLLPFGNSSELASDTIHALLGRKPQSLSVITEKLSRTILGNDLVRILRKIVQSILPCWIKTPLFTNAMINMLDHSEKTSMLGSLRLQALLLGSTIELLMSFFTEYLHWEQDFCKSEIAKTTRFQDIMDSLHLWEKGFVERFSSQTSLLEVVWYYLDSSIEDSASNISC